MSLSPLENKCVEELAKDLGPNPVAAMEMIGAAARGERTDALTERANEWVGIALTHAKVRPVDGADAFFTAALPPLRRFCAIGGSEGLALERLRESLLEHARFELLAGRELHTWEGQIPEPHPDAVRLVRLSHLRHLLRVRAKEWGGERTNLPAGAVERCLVEIDAVVTRHAMKINASPPRRN